MMALDKFGIDRHGNLSRIAVRPGMVQKELSYLEQSFHEFTAIGSLANVGFHPGGQTRKTLTDALGDATGRGEVPLLACERYEIIRCVDDDLFGETVVAKFARAD